MTYKSIGLVDFSHALRVNYHVRNPDGTPTTAGEQTLAQLSDWKRSVDHLIVCLDSPPYDRTKAYPEYKGQRERDDGYIAVCKWTKARLEADGYSIAKHPGAEADDVIATLAHTLFTRQMQVRIIGSDKDALQCVRDGGPTKSVIVMAPLGHGEFETRDLDWVKKKYDVFPEQIVLLLAIMGDAGDNIPGIAGIGQKGAAKLINSFGTIERMRVEAVKEFEASKLEGAKPLSKFWERFLAGSPRLPEWLALTKLRTDVPLDVDALLVKRAPAKLVEEHGDAWEPSAEELEEERELLDPEVVISSPKATATKEELSSVASFDTSGSAFAGKTEVKQQMSAPSSTEPLPETSKRGATAIADSIKRQPVNGDPVSIVVDRPAPPSWALALQPATAKEALQIASVLFNSRVCSQFGSERGVYAVISLGRELGLGMMASLQGFHIVNDKPFASSNLLRALAEKDPNCEWLICTHADEHSATWATKHRKIAEPMSYTYTRERAELNGMFTGKNAHNWKTKTTEMLEKTAGAKGARRWYPSSTLGLHIPEELGDD